MTTPSQVVTVRTSEDDDPIRYSRYANIQSIILGSIHLVCGLLSLVFCIVAMGKEILLGPLSLFRNGIWIGIFFMICGALGIASGVTKRRGYVVANMVLCILNIFMSLVGLGFAVFASLGYTFCIRELSSLDDCPVLQGMSGTYAFITFVEFVISIWSSALGCAVSCACCGCYSGPTTVVTYQSGGQPNPAYVQHGIPQQMYYPGDGQHNSQQAGYPKLP